MNKQRVTFRLVTIALGTALVSAAALAQNYGRPANDGGAVSAAPGAATVSNPPAQQSAPQSYGRPANDGGYVEAQPGQQPLYNSAPNQKPSTAQPSTAQPGRPANDGGYVR